MRDPLEQRVHHSVLVWGHRDSLRQASVSMVRHSVFMRVSLCEIRRDGSLRRILGKFSCVVPGFGRP